MDIQNSDGSVWTNGKGDSFVNPFMKEVWKYDIDVAKAAAKQASKIFNLTMYASQDLKIKQIA